MNTDTTSTEEQSLEEIFDNHIMTEPPTVPAVAVKMQSPTTTDASNETILSMAEQRIDLINKITILCLKITNPSDWEKLGDNAYLKASGCKKIARLFGVSSEITSIVKEFSTDDKGSYYLYTYTMLFHLKNPTGKIETIQEVGTKSSRAQFFAKEKGKLKLTSEIDETNIKKSALTNCYVRGLKTLLGMDNLTWDQLQAAWANTGKKIEKIHKVNYNEGTISEAQGKRLFAISKQANVTNDQLKDYLKVNYNIDSSRDIKKKDYEAICNALGAK
jgi:hypothetical protein